MSAPAANANLIEQARHIFADALVSDMQALLQSITDGAHDLADRPAERALSQQRFDMVQTLRLNGPAWPDQLKELVHRQMTPLDSPDSAASALVNSLQGQKDLSLVDDATVRREISISRLALAIMDLSTWELTDLRARAMRASSQSDFSDDDIFRPQVMARVMVRSWLACGLSLEAWQGLEPVLHKALSQRGQAAYHETNRWLIDKGVLPEVDLRPFIRRSDGTPTQPGGLDPDPASVEAPELRAGGDGSSAGGGGAGAGGHAGGATPPAWRRLFGPLASDAGSSSGRAGGHGGGVGGPGGGMAGGHGNAGAGAGNGGGGGNGAGAGGGGYGGGGGGGGGGAGGGPGGGPAGAGPTTHGGAATSYRRGYDDETRMMTRPVGAGHVHPDVVLEQFGQIVERHLPGFLDTGAARPPSEKLSEAMARAQQELAAQVDGAADGAAEGGGALGGGPAIAASPEQVLREMRERQVDLKRAASSPTERATIELVALLFQSILTDDRIPASIRVWFARLQMPVLRVAIAEPDFFSSEDHPARRLIDRMGSCVMGFEGSGSTEAIGPALEAEIKRIVQVVEAFPDTGRRVFQTVLNEFEKFLETYYADHDATTRMGISLAQQVEQRETLAIQYTIELRKLLSDMPVQDGVREFLFHVWADVLATAAIRHGGHSDEVRGARDAATELVWTATAKTTREERAQVIRRLPPLLATLRAGMNAVGMAAQRQEEAIKALNLALTAAFGARAATVSVEQFEHLKHRLETIEEMIPDDDFEIDDSWVLDESNHSSEGLEVVSEGGSLPGPAMVEWAMQLRLGDAFTLDFHGRHETVRLVWQGMHRQLSLFSAGAGRCVLFQKARLAAFLQAGLLLPLEEESLTASATREALRRIEADPSRLLH